MKKSRRRRLLSVVLAVCLSLAMAAGAWAAEAGDMTDLPTNAWYDESVAYCLEHNYMAGVSATRFHPEGEMTRAAMVQVLYNLEGRPQGTYAVSFADVGRDAWYYPAVAWAQEAQITSGTSSTTFSPNAPITREQAAAMFANYARYTGTYDQPADLTALERFADGALIADYARQAVAWAVTSGLMAGTDSTIFSPRGTCTRAQMAQILYNRDAVPPAVQGDTLYVQVGDAVFSATLADNAAADALAELLRTGPRTISMSDYGGFEKVGSLGQSLPASNSQMTTQAGDIVLYQGSQIVMFYGSNSWSYTRLAKLDDLTGWEEALGRGDVSVTFSLTEPIPA